MRPADLSQAKEERKMFAWLTEGFGIVETQYAEIAEGENELHEESTSTTWGADDDTKIVPHVGLNENVDKGLIEVETAHSDSEDVEDERDEDEEELLVLGSVRSQTSSKCNIFRLVNSRSCGRFIWYAALLGFIGACAFGHLSSPVVKQVTIIQVESKALQHPNRTATEFEHFEHFAPSHAGLKKTSKPINVCVSMEKTIPTHASLLLGTLFSRFGSSLKFAFTDRDIWNMYPGIVLSRDPIMKAHVKAGHALNCDPKWPRVFLSRIFSKPKDMNHFDRLALNAMVADEHCACVDDLCGNNSLVPVRQYYSSNYGSRTLWMPLGPRFEFSDVPDHLRSRDPMERKYAVNFAGSINNQLRRMIVDLFNPKALESYPADSPMRKSKLAVSDGWHPKHETKGDGSDLGYERYRESLLDSTFVLCPKGSAFDTFRMYETIEAGAIPVVVLGEYYTEDDGCSDTFEQLFDTNPPFVMVESPEELPATLERLYSQPKSLRARQQALLMWRERFWTRFVSRFQCTLISHHEKMRLSDNPLKPKNLKFQDLSKQKAELCANFVE